MHCRLYKTTRMLCHHTKQELITFCNIQLNKSQFRKQHLARDTVFIVRLWIKTIFRGKTNLCHTELNTQCCNTVWWFHFETIQHQIYLWLIVSYHIMVHEILNVIFASMQLPSQPTVHVKLRKISQLLMRYAKSSFHCYTSNPFQKFKHLKFISNTFICVIIKEGLTLRS